ncbi:hypothetical protein J6U78_03890 [bacterium]|nr:hypothetical protein [bacterium]
MDAPWYNAFLAQSDQNLRAEEYEPVILFANAQRTPLTQVVRYGDVIYNGSAKECVNIRDHALRNIKITTDVHEYRSRLKFPNEVTISAATAGDGGTLSGTGTKWDGQTIASNKYVLKLSTYNQGTTADLMNLAEARAVTENMAVTNESTDEVYTVLDVDKGNNAILVRLPSSGDANLPGSNYGGSAPAATNKLYLGTSGLFEKDYATHGAGLEKTAKYVNYAQFIEVRYGQSMSADNIRFQGGDPRIALKRAEAEKLQLRVDYACHAGQGKRILDPEDETNSQQFAQGVIPALTHGPNAGKNCVNLNGSALTIDTNNKFLDNINQLDNSSCPVFASSRYIRACNRLVQDKVRTGWEKTSAGLQIMQWKSDLGMNDIIYDPTLDYLKISVPTIDASGNITGWSVGTVDCIKYDFNRWAKQCTLVPFSVRPDIGKYTGSTILEQWMYCIITWEWNQPGLGGVLCNVA